MADRHTVLVADHIVGEAETFKKCLQAKGYRVLCASNGDTAYGISKNDTVDVALINRDIHSMDGKLLLCRIRENGNIPIIVYAEDLSDYDKISCLDLGADDVLETPANPLEMVARVKAQTRRYYVLNPALSDNENEHVLRIGELCLDTENLTLTKNGAAIQITPNEYKILHTMMRYPGRTFSKEDLCRAINGMIYSNYENAIMVHIFHLREKIEDDSKKPRYIKNIRGVGYMMSNT